MLHTGRSKLLIDAVLRGKIDLIISREIDQVIARDKFKLSAEDQESLIDFVLRIGHVVRLKSRFKIVREDSDNDILIRTAFDSRADYIVSGDKHLPSLKEHRGIKVLTVNEMLAVLNKERRQACARQTEIHAHA